MPRVDDHSQSSWPSKPKVSVHSSSEKVCGASSVVELTDIATRTDDIEIGSAILNVFSRSPAVLAMTATTLDRVSDGRAVLGLGTSTARSIGYAQHGVRATGPSRPRDVDIIEQLMTGDERVTYDGEAVSVRGVPPLDRDVPVYHAALEPANRRVVASSLTAGCPTDCVLRTDSACEYIAETARDADRDSDDITVAPYVPAVVHEDPSERPRNVRQHIALRRQRRGYRRAVCGDVSGPRRSASPTRRGTLRARRRSEPSRRASSFIHTPRPVKMRSNRQMSIDGFC